MGTGICGAIPIEFTQSYNDSKLEDLFLANYDFVDESYVIKSGILIDNFKDLMLEFYTTIEEIKRFNKIDWSKLDTIIKTNDDELFFSYLENKGHSVPFMEKGYGLFSTLNMDCERYIVFYIGSYKAYLEDYSTLAHMEKLTSKLLKNKLSSCIKFGIFG